MFGERSLARNSRKGILANSAGCSAAGARSVNEFH
jgi:hypothetical protein